MKERRVVAVGALPEREGAGGGLKPSKGGGLGGSKKKDEGRRDEGRRMKEDG
jgi:hypothetical protein